MERVAHVLVDVVGHNVSVRVVELVGGEAGERLLYGRHAEADGRRLAHETVDDRLPEALLGHLVVFKHILNLRRESCIL